jgi:hypothetical protein
MTKIVKLTESDLTNIIKRVISEQDEYYNPDRMYRRSSMINRIQKGPKFIHKYIKTLPYLKKEGSDEVWTKIPQVVWQNL